MMATTVHTPSRSQTPGAVTAHCGAANSKDPGIGELVMEPHRRRQDDEEDEHRSAQRVAEEPAARDLRRRGVPQQLGGDEPEAREIAQSAAVRACGPPRSSSRA